MERFEQVLQQGYRFNMESYFGKGWELFKKGAGGLIGYTILVFFASIVVSFIPFVGLLNGFLQAAFIAGIFVYCRQLSQKNENFNQFFEGFSSFGQIAIYVLLRFLFTLPLIALIFTVIFPFELLSDLILGDIDPEFIAEEIALGIQENFGTIMLFYLIIIAGFVYIYISYAFTLPLIVDAKLDFWQAMETSRRIIGKQFFMFLLMFLLIGIVGGVAIGITCGLGAFVVFPYLYCIIYAAYDEILQPQKDNIASEISSFGEKEDDVNTESEDAE